MAGKQYLSKSKYDELVKELDYLKHTRRREVAEALEYAKSLGDLSENSEYQEARETQSGIEERISNLEGLLKTATIISSNGNGKRETVDVGSIVIVQKVGAGKEQRYHVVGSEEANMAEAKISNQSPLGEAMIGRKPGETFSFKTPAGEVSYKIISVE
jgi:transcription elongation factor GreA